MTSPPTLNPTVEAFWGFEVRGVARIFMGYRSYGPERLQMRSAWITWSPNNQQLVNLKHISIYIYTHTYAYFVIIIYALIPLREGGFWAVGRI